MFKSDCEWDDDSCCSKLVEALFGDISAVVNSCKDINDKPLKKCTGNGNAKLVKKESGDDILSRKQWKMKQKNKRKANNKYKTKIDVKDSDLSPNMVSGLDAGDSGDENCPSSDETVFKTVIRNKRCKLNTTTPEKLEICSVSVQSVCTTAKKEKNMDLKKDSHTIASEISVNCHTDTNVEGRSASLKKKLTDKLNSSRFRYINEQMYASSSEATKKLFENDPSAFSVYHHGFLTQVEKWPVKPLDAIISWLKSRSPKLVVADLGCGEAFLAQSVKNKVYSFDLVALNNYVTVADVTKIPLDASTVDVVVCCLSLMGTNFVESLAEANRILKPKGILKVAEVASRFRGTKRFISDLKKLGFDLLKKDLTNSHFYAFDFRKSKTVDKSFLSGRDLTIELRPCVYKKR